MRRLVVVALLASLAVGCSNYKVPPGIVGAAVGASVCGVAASELRPSALVYAQAAVGTLQQHFKGDPMSLSQIKALLGSVELPPTIQAGFAPLLVELSRQFSDSDIVKMDNKWVVALRSLLNSCSAAFGVQTSIFLETSSPVRDPFEISAKAYEVSTK